MYVNGISAGKRLTPPYVWDICPFYLDQLRKMCDLLYAAHTNIDYFPTNFVVQKEELYYIDFECNEYMEEWNFENWGIKYWSKTPEFLQYVKEHI